MLVRLKYYGIVILTVPFLWLGLLVALVELVLRGDGRVAAWVVSPFTWAIRRGRRPEWQRERDGSYRKQRP